MKYDDESPNPFEGAAGGASVSYMLRNTQQQLVTLSSQADVKANMVITASALLMTLSIAQFNDSDLRIGAIVLAVGAFVTLVLAVLAVLPSAFLRPRTGANNPLFFVNVAAMSLDDYEVDLASHCHGEADVYRLQARDIYEQSSYLANSKFRRLRRAYVALLIAVSLATAVQGIATLTR